MRMWNVPTSMLCRKHLLREHVENHMFAGTINKNKSLKGFIEKGLVEVHSIQSRHEELVHEMKLRGYNHKSPLNFVYNGNPIGSVDSVENIRELSRRCPECKKRIQEYGIII